jgi:hypothetical protein
MACSFLRQRFVGFGIAATVSTSTLPARTAIASIGLLRRVVCSAAYISNRGLDAFEASA